LAGFHQKVEWLSPLFSGRLFLSRLKWKNNISALIGDYGVHPKEGEESLKAS
jgi:hypothetical protein